ncbi:MAG TPA: chemotaxis protein CheW [Pyrinomonadaceae bacterium]|nr:chemotaxis protein CheW [Pyrinomonadaceae bacterium]
MPDAESHSEILADATTDARRNPVDPDLRDLFVFEAGARTFAVPADQVDGITEARVPVVLPHTPQAILGVVCVRGRMLTVVDPTVLLTGQSLRWPHALPCVIALRGDEQLALAAQSCRDQIKIAVKEIRPASDDSENTAFKIVRHDGEEIIVLNVNYLFASAMRQRERRRRRF